MVQQGHFQKDSLYDATERQQWSAHHFKIAVWILQYTRKQAGVADR